eukprot:CAMPEP_0116046392 /NCGR_PEP_ID=MMETSP0321-20121206/28243_1 /TAXON_ID=163516 /ORGANISM="Leptocylindrus danicus var. danicus, Strain B650" /LENGTH=90 /DNA_ID=CAMNT_0003528021 /DNA_START=476 /DNA_END=748 /DNA_ORIENTATION=-
MDESSTQFASPSESDANVKADDGDGVARRIRPLNLEAPSAPTLRKVIVLGLSTITMDEIYFPFGVEIGRTTTTYRPPFTEAVLSMATISE